MNKENIPVITDREKIYDKCENMEQLFDNYYLPLLDKHYSKTYELQQEIQELKKQIEDLKEEKQEWINLLDMFKNQQKEFIKYLENEISKWHYNYDSNTYEYELEEPPAEELLVSSLSKYKEIIGGK